MLCMAYDSSRDSGANTVFAKAPNCVLKEMEKYPQNCFVCYVEDTLAGVALHRAANGETSAGITLYVVPQHRRRGVGRALFQALKQQMLSLGVKDLVADGQEDPAMDGFLKHLGFVKKFSSRCMEYSGGPLQEEEGCTEPYQPQWYEEFYEMKSAAFVELRQLNGLEPFKYEYSPSEKSFMEKHLDDYFVIRDKGAIVACASCVGGELDDVAVALSHQGKGLSKALVRHGINLAYAQGHDKCILWVLVNNTKAEGLYQSMGFTFAGVNGYYTLQL